MTFKKTSLKESPLKKMNIKIFYAKSTHKNREIEKGDIQYFSGDVFFKSSSAISFGSFSIVYWPWVFFKACRAASNNNIPRSSGV